MPIGPCMQPIDELNPVRNPMAESPGKLRFPFQRVSTDRGRAILADCWRQRISTEPFHHYGSGKLSFGDSCEITRRTLFQAVSLGIAILAMFVGFVERVSARSCRL